MPRRARWKVPAAAAGALLVGGAIVMFVHVTSTTDVPYHAWTREGDDRLYDAAGGREFAGWRLALIADHWATIEPPPPGALEKLRAWFGPKARAARRSSMPVASALASPRRGGWQEWVVLGGDWPKDAVIDPGLAGRWNSAPGAWFVLGEGGTGETAGTKLQRAPWGRLGNLILIASRDGTAVQHVYVLDETAGVCRGPGPSTYTRVR